MKLSNIASTVIATLALVAGAAGRDRTLLMKFEQADRL